MDVYMCAQVHVIYRADLPLRGFDKECREMLAENMNKRGITVSETLALTAYKIYGLS